MRVALRLCQAQRERETQFNVHHYDKITDRSKAFVFMTIIPRVIGKIDGH